MAQLLVSVRSALEAREALKGGAALIDIKEPNRGALGRADSEVWRSVLDEVAGRVPVSIALGELTDACTSDALSIPGLSFRKIGLAWSTHSWHERWSELRDRDGSIPWVAVIYADGADCGAPTAREILDEALSVSCCRGVLIDTFHKDRPCSIDLTWRSLVAEVQDSGRLAVVAGSLDSMKIEQLAPLAPDYFAVRGAACVGDRTGPIASAKVAALVAILG